MRYVIASEGVDIVLGRQGENQVVTVQFDVTGWAEEYGVGEFLIFNERSKDTAAYPCTVTQTGERLDWVIESADVYYSGYGRVQLTYIVNNAVAKSVIYYTVVLPSLDAGDAPTPTPEWIQDVLNYRLDSEAYALGTRDGVAVPQTDPAYQNNAKYYAELYKGIFWVTGGVTTSSQIEYAIYKGEYPVLAEQTGSGFVYIPLLRKTTVIQTGVVYYYFEVVDGSGNAYGRTLTVDNMGDSWGAYSSSKDLATSRDLSGKVSTSRKINDKALTSNITLTSADIGYDNAPTKDSNNYVSSGGVYTAINAVGSLLISKGVITQAEWDAR